MPEEMVSFEEAMKRLQFTEDEIQKLVTSGALRAFRSGGEMKFRASDLEAVKKERETEPTIIIPAASGDEGEATAVAGRGGLKVEMPEDLVDESAQTVVGGGDRGQGAPTVTIPEDQGTEELVFDDKELEVLPLEEEAAGTQAAEAATVVEGGGDITVAEGAGGEAAAEEGKPPSSRRRQPLSSRVAPAVSRRKSAAFEVRRGNPIMSVVLMLTAAAAIFALCVFGAYMVENYRTGIGTAGESRYEPGFLKDLFEGTKKWGEPK